MCISSKIKSITSWNSILLGVPPWKISLPRQWDSTFPLDLCWRYWDTWQDKHEILLSYSWLVVSSLKNISQLGWLFPRYGTIKNVPKHQPDSIRQHFDHLPRPMFHTVSPPLVVGYDHMLLYFGAPVVPIPPLSVHTPKVHENACFAEDHISNMFKSFPMARNQSMFLPKKKIPWRFPVFFPVLPCFPSHPVIGWPFRFNKTAIHGDPWLGRISFSQGTRVVLWSPTRRSLEGGEFGTIRGWLVVDLPWIISRSVGMKNIKVT